MKIKIDWALAVKLPVWIICLKETYGSPEFFILIALAVSGLSLTTTHVNK